MTKADTNFSFTCDYNGDMLTDSRKSITGMIYDRRNLTTRMSKPSSVNYDYYYDDAGQRIFKQTSSTNKEFYLRDHTGKELAVYDWVTGKLKMINLYGSGIIGKVNVSYNAQNVRTDSRQYYFKDHLGSIRQVYDETATIVSAQDYYPYGDVLRSYVTGGNLNDKYKFTEKERDVETNYDYFGARYYDSEFGRWISVDPLADKYPGWSPYNYTLNNPLRFTDPNGMDTTSINSYAQYDSKTNTETATEVITNDLGNQNNPAYGITTLTTTNVATINSDGSTSVTSTTVQTNSLNPSLNNTAVRVGGTELMTSTTRNFVNNSATSFKNTGQGAVQTIFGGVNDINQNRLNKISDAEGILGIAGSIGAKNIALRFTGAVGGAIYISSRLGAFNKLDINKQEIVIYSYRK